MLKSRTIIATPAYRGEVVMQYCHSLVRDMFLMMADGHYADAPFFVNDTYVHWARNRCLKEFLSTDCDYLMFIDADMSWEALALGRMLAMPRDMDIVGGVYRKKEEPEFYPFHPMPGVPIQFPVCRVMGIPTGFMRINRNAAERMMRAFDDQPFAFARIDGIDYGEDLLFCRRACYIGLSVHGVFDIQFGHHGPREWSGRASDHLKRLEGQALPGEPIQQAKIDLLEAAE